MTEFELQVTEWWEKSGKANEITSLTQKLTELEKEVRELKQSGEVPGYLTKPNPYLVTEEAEKPEFFGGD